MENRRKEERLKKKLKCEVHSEGMTFSSTLDVSAGGLFISTPEPFHEGEIVRLQMYMPEEKEITARGRVKWYRENVDNELPSGMGIEFIDLSDEDLKSIYNSLK